MNPLKIIHHYCYQRYNWYQKWNDYPRSSHVHRLALAIFLLGLAAGFNFQTWIVPPELSRATDIYSWTQTDWSASGELTLALTSGSVAQTSSNDFDNGVNNQTEVSEDSIMLEVLEKGKDKDKKKDKQKKKITYQSQGDFTSSAINVGQASDFTTLIFNISEPADTDVKFQLRSASAEAELSSAIWYGPTGVGDYYTASDTAINAIHDGSQWVQYKAFFSTANTAVTAGFSDITVNYTYYSVSASFISSPYNTADPTNTISQISWLEILPLNTGIKFRLRTAPDSNGSPGAWSNWLGPTGANDYYTDLTGGETTDPVHTDGIDDQWIQYQVFLSTTNTTTTPVLSEVTLFYKPAPVLVLEDTDDDSDIQTENEPVVDRVAEDIPAETIEIEEPPLVQTETPITQVENSETTETQEGIGTNPPSENTETLALTETQENTEVNPPAETAPREEIANIPNAPRVQNATTTTLNLVIDTNSNPSNTEFAIQETASGRYVQSDGALGTNVVWRTYTSWGGAEGQIVENLESGVDYTFKVKARNNEGAETAWSAVASGTTTALRRNWSNIVQRIIKEVVPVIKIEIPMEKTLERAAIAEEGGLVETKGEPQIAGKEVEKFKTIEAAETYTLEYMSLKFGDLIRSISSPALYYLAPNNQRYLFLNFNTFNTWYPDFSQVKIIPESQLDAISTGGYVTYRPGVKMVKITTSPKVYVVDKGGVLKWTKNETLAKALYGENWNQRIDDLPKGAFEDYYTVEGAISAASQFNPEVKKEAVPDIKTNLGL